MAVLAGLCKIVTAWLAPGATNKQPSSKARRKRTGGLKTFMIL
jgi:hypothetical protein